ncbi:YggS family pyridoxal phosphate-dependent enzyme [Cytobacillus sp. IB215316]|uniref:YggS family pyridoxal phosphate-dependent enzyme n=1 Tax=Cytobacillus sp. IB215316 TaxID=3097354 RepID=UPI002A1036F7|nr:YggS family pyridoxal phosphate-dependent enzyme [Cytobacillus sp. IB215316]MDX8360013.1 YggS family pyridoxal phosphate-dependent enzyme [Cytobacillus sp. IB215316]
MSVEVNLAIIEEKITEASAKVNRDRNDINIIAVTKYVTVERVEEAIQAGITHFGENRDQGFNDKWEQIGAKVTWHFIGTLQTRKVKNIINKVDYIHSLDRLSLAEEIQKRATKPIKCFIQVNTSGEGSKHGMSPDEVLPFIEKIKDFSNVSIVGLMTMAPQTDDVSIIRLCFNKLKELQQQVQALSLAYAPCLDLSMGMSNDYEIAIEEGATYLRIGSSLVGNEQ